MSSQKGVFSMTFSFFSFFFLFSFLLIILVKLLESFPKMYNTGVGLGPLNGPEKFMVVVVWCWWSSDNSISKVQVYGFRTSDFGLYLDFCMTI